MFCMMEKCSPPYKKKKIHHTKLFSHHDQKLFPSYQKIFDVISRYIDNLHVNFSKHNSISDRKLFSLKKVKRDIQWEPEYSIEKGIKDYIDNLA